MKVSGGCRMMSHHQQHQHLRLGFCSSSIVGHSNLLISKSRLFNFNHRAVVRQLKVRASSSSCSHFNPKSHLHSFSAKGGEHQLTHEALSTVAGGVVALGKFDALHVGHRQLAIQASKVGTPYLLSFSGMAEVLGWEPRPPIVAKSDRRRVLSSWAPYCGNVVPMEFQVEFSSVRHLTPRQFVEKLSKDLGVQGVVAGENYRFGYKAAGDAFELVRLCKEFGIGAYIINPVMDKKQIVTNTEPNNSKERGQVSSTRVRHALALGDMNYVSELLGRPHQLVLMVKGQEGSVNTDRNMMSFPKSCLLNLPPKDGLYKNCSLVIGNEYMASTRVLIDTTHIHLEMDAISSCIYSTSQEVQLLGIEFGNLEY